MLHHYHRKTFARNAPREKTSVGEDDFTRQTGTCSAKNHFLEIVGVESCSVPFSTKARKPRKKA